MISPNTIEATKELYKYLVPYTKHIIIDKSNESLTIYQKSKENNTPIQLNFNQINSFELIIDEKTIISSGYTDAILGNILFGETGAVVGATSSTKEVSKLIKQLQIKINLNPFDQPVIYISYLQKNEKLIN